MGRTKRSQNKCKSCGYTWYPRGKNISLKCPNCGSSEVSVVGSGVFIIGALLIAAFVLFGEKKESTQSPSKTEEPTVIAQEDLSSKALTTPEPTESLETRQYESATVQEVDAKPLINDKQASENCSAKENEECTTPPCSTSSEIQHCLKNTPTNELY